MDLWTLSVAVEQQSRNPVAASSRSSVKLEFPEAKSSREMSRETLIAIKSAHIELISCLALRRPRATLLVSVMICRKESQYTGRGRRPAATYLRNARSYRSAPGRYSTVSRHVGHASYIGLVVLLRPQVGCWYRGCNVGESTRRRMEGRTRW